MIIDNKSKEIGITERLAYHLLNRTKHKGADIIRLSFWSVDYYGNYCIKFELENAKRKEITIHINSEKIKKFRREIALNILLD